MNGLQKLSLISSRLLFHVPALHNSSFRTCVAAQRCLSTSARNLSSRFFSEKHEWVSVEDGVGTVGISEHAQDALGEIVFVELPEAGKAVQALEQCGTLESVKAASELYSPVSGTVLSKNEAAEKQPKLINSSCYKEGWLFKIRLSNSDELKKLMTESQYGKFLEESA